MFLMDSTAYNALIDIIVKRTTLLRVSQVCFWYFGFWGYWLFSSFSFINWTVSIDLLTGWAGKAYPTVTARILYLLSWILVFKNGAGLHTTIWKHKNTSMCNNNTDWCSPLLHIHMYIHNTTVLCAANGATMHYEYTQENSNLSGS